MNVTLFQLYSLIPESALIWKLVYHMSYLLTGVCLSLRVVISFSLYQFLMLFFSIYMTNVQIRKLLGRGAHYCSLDYKYNLYD